MVVLIKKKKSKVCTRGLFITFYISSSMLILNIHFIEPYTKTNLQLVLAFATFVLYDIIILYNNQL